MVSKSTCMLALLASTIPMVMLGQQPVAPPVKLKAVVSDSIVTSKQIKELDSKLLEIMMTNDMYDYMHDAILSSNDSLPFEPTIPTEVLKERLSALNASTPFRVEYNPELERVIAKYLKRNTAYMEKVMTLSDYYFPMIESILDKHDIPLEMKYLAIVESALNPKAKSRAGATGMWQFMYGTGKNYGLEVSSYVDERMDPIKATEAACKYLKALYAIYGDWDLVLAAYNSGPGNVNKAIKRSGGITNYWNLRNYLPRETANYVPAFQATMYIYQYAKEHGYRPGAACFKRIETDTLVVKEKLSLERLAQFLDEDLETLQFLNPSYKLDIVPVVPGKTSIIRLPREAANTFVLKEEEVYAFVNPRPAQQSNETTLATATATAPIVSAPTTSKQRVTYTVRSGDFLGKIAERYSVGVSELRAWNNLRSNNLKVGQRLVIHTNQSTTVLNKEVKNAKTHTVKSGDSFWKIARKYGLTIDTLKRLNPQAAQLTPGLKLRLS